VPIYFWVVPTKVGGRWRGRAGDNDVTADLTQSFQKISGTLSLANVPLSIRLSHVAGRTLTLDARDETRTIALAVTAADNAMSGTLTIDGTPQPIELRRSSSRP